MARALGRDKRAVVEPHVGGTRLSAEVEEDSLKCFELHWDGPRREQDFFVQSAESGVLFLTVCSQACATSWLETRGRRFGANAKVRKGVGVADKRARSADGRGPSTRSAVLLRTDSSGGKRCEQRVPRRLAANDSRGASEEPREDACASDSHPGDQDISRPHPDEGPRTKKTAV